MPTVAEKDFEHGGFLDLVHMVISFQSFLSQSEELKQLAADRTGAPIVAFRTNLFFIDTLGCSYQTGSLKFRDHPLIPLRNGVKAWPPEWITASGNTTTGEVGILEYMSIGLLIDTTFFLFINYKHSRYVGLMSFDDSISCQKVYDLLKPNTGRSIKEIGGLELEP